jgi:hypothetical protein
MQTTLELYLLTLSSKLLLKNSKTFHGTLFIAMLHHRTAFQMTQVSSRLWLIQLHRSTQNSSSNDLQATADIVHVNACSFLSTSVGYDYVY